MKPLEDVLKQHEEKYYWKSVYCSNCGYRKAVAILKKNRVEECICPNCECKTII